VRARAGDGAEVLDELGLRHADARVLDDELLLVFQRTDADRERALSFHEAGLGERAEPQLVERVGRIRHELAEEDLLVRVERVDDERQDTADLGLKGMNGHRESH
jgi:hypothetical protein